MQSIKNISRLGYIQFILLRHGIDHIAFSSSWLRPVRYLAYLNPWNWRLHARQTRGKRIRLALEKLGPIFVKFGQMLSTRQDLLPKDIAKALAKLQDDVAPFPAKQVKQILERAYDQPLSEIFAEIDWTPLASASVAQVHRARLPQGNEVVIKVLRPRIEKVIRRDVTLLYGFARIITWLWKDAKRLRLRDLVSEFEKTIFHELDLLREAANASQLRRNFAHSDLLYVPQIYWDYTHKNVLVMEYVEGVVISDLDELKRRNVDLKCLAERGVEIFFTQVFRDCFFHADMHPGNIFICTKDPKNPKYMAVDFGIMGSLDSTDQRYLAQNFLAFFNRDYRRVAELHIRSGWIPKDTRVDEFESAIRTVCEPIFAKPLSEISFGKLLVRLFQTAKQFDMYIQPQLFLLQKTLLNIEGLGRELYPELNLWTTAKPFLEDWVKSQLGPKALIKKLRTQLPDLLLEFLA